ncbi:hypothetical protein [Phnomibacter ginsenosidimutans]|uniref:Uncharacterized protein n=1 Tax=Phnomibacter ginsenosidimutans TaxID=2676868 RepID=A0A6I6G560_9BACT|nr:hypothetical protein [Phnomibacter ginsenosidimutans]QGW27184.1 hypothetical protein GLV81_02860 [Phnomibacter ginsenosidimutans]
MQYVKLIWMALCMGMMTMGSAHAQLTEQFSPDLNRALFHSRLDQAQKTCWPLMAVSIVS